MYSYWHMCHLTDVAVAFLLRCHSLTHVNIRDNTHANKHKGKHRLLFRMCGQAVPDLAWHEIMCSFLTWL